MWQNKDKMVPESKGHKVNFKMMFPGQDPVRSPMEKFDLC